MTATITEITGIHPYADKFPMLPEQELDELSESIRANGLRQPIVITPDGLILDGRNRYAACQRAGITPETVTYEGDDLAEFVIDCNVGRRHMSPGARAMSTALVLAADGRREKGRWDYGAINSNDLGNSMAEYVRRCGVVLDYKPDIAAGVIAGDIALDAAYQQAKAIKDSAERDKVLERERRKREKEQAQVEAERDARYVADLTMANSQYIPMIEAGQMTPKAAWAAHLADTEKQRQEEARLRQDDEKRVRAICEALATLQTLSHVDNRTRHRTAFAKHPEAVRPAARELHTPHIIRELIAYLADYATELESK